MDKLTNKELKSLELIHLSRQKYLQNSVSDPLEFKNLEKNESPNNFSYSQGINYTNLPHKGKKSFDLDQIREEISNRNSRLIQRDKEIEDV